MALARSLRDSEIHLVRPLKGVFSLQDHSFLVTFHGYYPRKGEFTRRSLWGLMVDVDVNGLTLEFRRKYYLTWQVEVSGRPWALVPVYGCHDIIQEYGYQRGVVLCRKLKLSR
jgi:hypothetical protein